MKPKVFIGSSTASLPVVRELERALQQHCNVTPWDLKGLFGAGDVILDRLLELSGKFDFAIFVFGFDDFLVGADVAVPRDNVLFELGLFMSKLGRYNAVAVVPEMDGKKIKILSDLGGVITLRYEAPSEPRHLATFLNPVVTELISKIVSPSSPQSVRTGDSTHPDVHSLLQALGEVVAKRMAKSQTVKVCNLALDMETTWSRLRDDYLEKPEVSGIDWKTLMIDPNAEAIRALRSYTVSTATAATRIGEMQKFFPRKQPALKDRKIEVQVRAYSSIPVMHGFLVDDEILFLSFCGIRQVSAKRSGQVINELIGAPTAYWQFDKKSSNPASCHFVSAFASWFDFLWKSGSRPIWPVSPTRGRH